MKKNKKKVILLIASAILLNCLMVKPTMAEKKNSFLNSIFSRSLNGWYRENDKWFFYNNNEKVTGWVKNKGQWYYLDEKTGIMQTGWVEELGKKYYLDSSGIMKTGWLNLSGTWYYLNKDGSMKTGWLNDKNKWYYLNPVNGEMAIGWVNDNGIWYYTDSSGVMRTGWLNLSGTWYYLNKDGSMKTGWLNDKNKWYYLKPVNGGMVVGWVNDNGTWYYTDSSGAMKIGWLNLSGIWYYLNPNGSMKTGWLNDKNKWYYLKPVNGEMAIGWVNDNGTWYYTDSSGVMKTGWLNLSGIWYYLNSSGSMKTGWLNEKNKWYYLKPENGAMVTGWIDDNGSWYYADTSGVMKTGWLKENNYWYYLKSNGVMATGWNNINNKVYYFYNSGKMAVGDLYLDNKWYLFDESGYRKTGWIKKGYNWNYYDNKSGELLTNSWLDEGTKRYWLKADGAMAIGEVVINGVLNKFDNNGYFIGTDIVDKSKELYIKVLDLGNAEAIYIELPNGDDVLIDGGEIYNTKKVIDFLNEQDLDEGDGIKDIEYVINTHPHSDHTAGLIGVFQNFKVNNLYYPHDVEMKYYEGFEGSLDEINGHRVNCMNYCYQFYIEMLAEAKKQRTVIYDTIPGNYVDELGILKFVHPNKTYKQDNLDRVDGNINSYDYCLFNNDSAVILIDYNELQMLLASDIEKEAEEDMINMGLVKPNSIDILKVGHHGYDTSTTKRFVDYLNPSLAIIARSSNNYMNTNAFNNLITNRTIIKETWKSNGVEIIATINGWNVY